MRNRFAKPSILPGFGLSLGYTLVYLSLIVLIPLALLFLKASNMGWQQFWETVTAPRILASYKISFLTSFLAAGINAVFGLMVAWVFTRYSFPGKRILDGLIDLPFALPTAVAGISLTALYASNGWIGKYLDAFGIKAAFTPFGITIALIFIGLPFVVRTVQPVIQDLEKETEEAAATLGASKVQTFLSVTLPQILPAMLTGFSLAFARALGEYGSVVFISGNMPMKTEIAPLLIMTKLEQFDYDGAAAIAVVMLIVSFLILLLINFIQWRTGIRGSMR